MYYDDVRKVEIVRYANNIYSAFFVPFNFFSLRDDGVNDFPTRMQQYSLASPFFSTF